MANELKRLVQSRYSYQDHLKRLFTSITELMEGCNPEEENADTFAKLLSQLKTILTDLDA